MYDNDMITGTKIGETTAYYYTVEQGHIVLLSLPDGWTVNVYDVNGAIVESLTYEDDYGGYRFCAEANDSTITIAVANGG